MKKHYRMITDLKALEDYLGSATMIAFDFETAPHERWKETKDAALDPHKAYIVGISLSVAEGTGIYVPLAHKNVANADEKRIFDFLKQAVFQNPNVTKIAHNLSFEAKFLLKKGIILALPVYDTIVAAQMMLIDDNHFRRLAQSGLKTLAWEILGTPLPSYTDTVGTQSFADLDPDDFQTITYACADADIALGLYHCFNHWFKKNMPSHEILIRTLESPVAIFVAMMEERGFLVDASAMIASGKHTERMLTTLRKKLEAAGTRPINIGANAATNDFKKYLFGDCGLPILKRTVTGQPSVDGEALNRTIDYCQTRHPKIRDFLKEVAAYRGLSKLYKTYIIGLTDKINPATGAIHTRFFPLGTETGRFSSQTPNCQNLPAGEIHGVQVRNFFVARPGFTLVALDYSQIELRIGAWITRDPKMLSVYRTGGDIHAQTTAAVYGISLTAAMDKAHPEYKLRRTVAKNINFGIFYGLYPKGLQRILKLKASINLEIEACQAMITNIHMNYPGLAPWQSQIKENAGYRETVDSALGRRRCLEGINAPDEGLQSHYQRAALNHPIQGTAAEILVLSFTKASATEMCQRIRKETGESIAAMTFHKLGMTIITAVNGVKPNITQISLSVFIRQSLNELIKNPRYLQKFINYLCFHRIKQKSEFEFTSQTEYDDYLELNQSITMKNEIVKSYGEMDIANYLYKNGINYQYETPYKTNTATKEYARYMPDFYLPDADIYIEYFGINRNGQVPDYFTGKNNKTASETYNESMTWKRMLHAENNTVMLELYSYDIMEGQLLQELERKLKAENVVFNPKSDSDLWDEIKTKNKSIFESLGKLFETVINLVKINDYPFEKVYELNKVHKGNQYKNNQSVFGLIEPIFNRYAAELSKNNEIDFNDMINLASKYVADGKYQHPYGYVIVDEYQDISKARYNLLKHLRDKHDYALFCVGDDWQSIYGFAGSDLNYILDFERYWGISEKSKIETTYRFSQSLIQVSSEFVMKNPKQIKKKLRSANEAGVMSINASNHANGFSLGLIEGYTAKNTVTFMESTITDLPQNSRVFFIGRYHNDVKIFENSPFKCHYENASGKTMVHYPKRSDLKIEFLTAHKSKGLQADYVFIINNKGKSYGFPSKIQNDEVVQLLLEESDDYQYSEERRLFYVAMTRTRKKAWLLVQKDNKSVFVQELFSGFAKELLAERYTCPQCGGRIFKKKGAYGEFFGCSNYPKGCTYTKKITVKKPV